jgi:hypothetical protein
MGWVAMKVQSPLEWADLHMQVWDGARLSMKAMVAVAVFEMVMLAILVYLTSLD